MKTYIRKHLLSIIFICISITSFSQNSNIIFEFELGADGQFFNVDNEGNLHAIFTISNLTKNNLENFTNKFKNNDGVIGFETKINKNNIIEASAKFRKADLNYFYKLFKNNDVSAIKINNKITKVKYIEFRPEEMQEPTIFENASNPNNIEYYEKHIYDAEYKIDWVQHDRDEIKKAIKSGWFEEADKLISRLKKEKNEFINNK